MKRLLLVAVALLCAVFFAPVVRAQQLTPVTASLSSYAGAHVSAFSLTNSLHSTDTVIGADGKISLQLYTNESYVLFVSQAGNRAFFSAYYYTQPGPADVTLLLTNAMPPVSAGTIDASGVAALIQSRTGCTTAGFVWQPQSNTCVAQSGGGSTASYAFSAFPTSLAAGTLILQTDSTEAGTCAAGGGSTYRLCRSLGPSAGFAAADDQTPTAIAALWEGGDSFTQCWGASNPTMTCAMAMLAANTPAPTYNIGQGGNTQGQTSALFYASFYGDATLPSAIVQIGGHNDGLHDSCGGTTTSGCAQNFKLMLDADIAWGSIPTAFRQMASTAAGSGWVADTTTVPIYSSAILASPGTAMKTTTSGSSLTFSVPSSASGFIGIGYPVTNGQTGSFTVTIDGVPRTDATTSTTSFSSGAAQGIALYGVTTAYFRQAYPVTANIAHTVVVTSTSSAAVNIGYVDWIPPVGTPNVNRYFFVGPNAYYQYAAAYDTIASQVVAAEVAAGLPPVYVSQINGTPGVNALTTAGGDLAAVASTVFPATSAAGHPSDLGQKNLLRTIENAETAAGFRFSRHRRNASADPYFTGPPTIQTFSTGNLPTLGQSFSYENTGTIFPYGQDFYRKGNNRLGDGYTQDPSTGMPWSGAYIKMVHSSIPGSFFCVDSLAQGGTLLTSQIPASSYVGKSCIRFSDGFPFFPNVQLLPTAAATCSATIAGQFQYTQGNSTTKDVVQVCAHDASNAYAWRTIY